ncbi:Deoxyuridine 5'-triphosphate nucleotidohydrolase [Hibiscus syriacus]|uniref:dUTP diphosphatase n=1 Tax=Hibiscus syriacus TaxID=106335 RepID=A0A6A3BB89_HIBSY|nr:Deoxyuridine 5'-triphosphate nucleotidohydrolase [Hibiscus syriacus]
MAEINNSPEIREPSQQDPKEAQFMKLLKHRGLAWLGSIPLKWVDADYRGPLGVILFNHSDIDFEVKVGGRIALLIIERLKAPDVFDVEDLDSNTRGAGGFGSTGGADFGCS